MNKLKIKIMKYFLLCSFGISVVESAIDSTFDELIFPRYSDNESMFIRLLVISFVISFLIFLLGALIFYQLTKRTIEAESRRQVQEQNLLYSYIAHDLKTPMTSVQGFASALKDGKIKPDEQSEILEIIYKKCRHMNDLIETLFSYSKLGTEGYALNLKKTNLCSLVRDLTAINYSEFEDRNMELKIEIPDKPIWGRLDEKEFRRAVNNMIVNAYKHNERETSILIKVREENGLAFVTVADDGAEISQELVETMFNPFVCGSASRTSGNGSGLGLAISSRIVEKHGGKMYVEKNINSYTKGVVIQIAVVK